MNSRPKNIYVQFNFSIVFCKSLKNVTSWFNMYIYIMPKPTCFRYFFLCLSQHASGLFFYTQWTLYQGQHQCNWLLSAQRTHFRSTSKHNLNVHWIDNLHYLSDWIISSFCQCTALKDKCLIWKHNLNVHWIDYLHHLSDWITSYFSQCTA